MMRPNAALIRWSGACWMVAGVLIAGAVTHPDIFETTFARAALSSPFWVEWHALWLVSVILTLFGLVGLYVRQVDRLGTLAWVGAGLAVPGLVLTGCAAFMEAFVMPPVARADPALLDWDGPLLTSWGLRVAGGLALAWPIGMLFVGLATWRADVLPRGAAAALAIGCPAFALLEGPFVPVLGVLSALVFAVAHIWLGYALWSDSSPARAPCPARPLRARPGATPGARNRRGFSTTVSENQQR